MGIRHGHDCFLSRISNGICENATRLHRLDLELLGRRAERECQFRNMITDLKGRLARMAVVSTRSVCADDTIELSYKAS